MKTISIKKLKQLPDQPGVYQFFDEFGELIYVGRATSLKSRVRSYFQGRKKTYNRPIERMIAEVVRIGYDVTPTVIESIILEANTIKKAKPKYNVMLRDDRSFAYLAITKAQYPQFKIVRGHELGVDWFVGKQEVPKGFSALYGPYTSARTITTALRILRDIFPYSTCKSGRTRPCFYYQLQKCPGVCVGEVSPGQYGRLIKPIIWFFEGKKTQIITTLKKQIALYAAQQRYEEAADARDQLYALEHIQDIALITREYESDGEPNPILGRVEGYDISNISGEYATGSMVVFEAGEASKSQYRKFKIKTVSGANDVAMMEEVIRRRLSHTEWPMPDVFLIDGGKPQVNRVHAVFQELGVITPIIGIAKGPTRKNAQLHQIGGGVLLAKRARTYLPILLAARDEAHRFAVQYHRKRRGARLKP